MSSLSVALPAITLHDVAPAQAPESQEDIPRRAKGESSALSRTVMPLLAASPFLTMAARILIHRRDPVYSGDAGLLAMAVRSAARGTRTLGPYSRFGFFHPGPAFFYVLVPFDWVSANATWALPFGVAVLNATVAATLVDIVQRAGRTSLGLLSGAAAALVALGYALAVDIGLLSIFWNPLQIMLPVALLLVAAAHVDGWDWPFAIVLLSATFVVQTHVATFPIAVVGVAAAGFFAARGAWRRPPSRSVSLALGLAVIAWIPPLWQQVSGSPGNVSRLVTFFRSSHESRPGWARAVAYAGRELAVFPDRMPWGGFLTPKVVSGRVGVSEFLLFVLVAGALVFVARARGTRRAFRLGVVSVASAFAAVYAVASIRGEVDWYLTAYMSAIAVPLALGWTLFALDVAWKWASRVIIVGLAICSVAAIVVAIRAPLYDNRAFPNEQRYRKDTEAAWNVLAPRLDRAKGRTLILGGDPRLVPTIAGVALKLENRGVGVEVTEPLVATFGPERRAPSDRSADILITTEAPDGYEVVGRTTAEVLQLPVVVSLREPREVNGAKRSPS